MVPFQKISRHFLPRLIPLPVYFAIFHSHMSYASLIWGQRPTKHKQRILILQKFAVRIITFSTWKSPTKPLFIELKLLNFFDFVKLSNILLIQKLIKNEIPQVLCDSFDLCKTQGCRQSSRKKHGVLSLPRVHTSSFGIYSIRYQAIITWNLIQKSFSFDDISDLSSNQLHFWLKFYFLSTYSELNQN